jgi:hypothetical protein
MSNRFTTNFFRWALEHSNKEIETDFELVRQFAGAGVEFFLKEMDGLDTRGKHLLARGLVKRFHFDAVTVLHELSNVEEEELVRCYLEKGTRAFTTGEWQALKPVEIGNRILKPDLRRRLLACVGNTLGNQIPGNMPGSVVFEVPLQSLDASVRTIVVLEGRGIALAYFQELWHPSGPRIATAVSALSWLGITGGPAAWEKVGEGNIERALVAIRNGAAEFIHAAPNLLSATL